MSSRLAHSGLGSELDYSVSQVFLELRFILLYYLGIRILIYSHSSLTGDAEF